MKKILKISLILVLVVVGILALIAILPNKSLDEIEEIQGTLVEIGYHDTMKNEFIDYVDLFVEALQNQHKYDEESLMDNLDRSYERYELREELRNKMSYFKERIEAKELSTETALEIKKISLEIIEETETYLLLTDADSFSQSEVEFIDKKMGELRDKFQELNAILNKYFS